MLTLQELKTFVEYETMAVSSNCSGIVFFISIHDSCRPSICWMFLLYIIGWAFHSTCYLVLIMICMSGLPWSVDLWFMCALIAISHRLYVLWVVEYIVWLNQSVTFRTIISLYFSRLSRVEVISEQLAQLKYVFYMVW